MIDIVEEYSIFDPDVNSLAPALDEFEDSIRQSLVGINHADLNQKLIIEAWIYGELVQILDKHGLRTYGLATGVRKYHGYFIVDVIVTEPASRTIRRIKIPLGK